MYYFLILFTQFTDWLTTYLGITKYHSHEANQFMANFINDYGMGYLLLYKLLVGLIIAYMFRDVKLIGWLAIVAFALVSIHNIVVFN
jgi:hypothetical protein